MNNPDQKRITIPKIFRRFFGNARNEQSIPDLPLVGDFPDPQEAYAQLGGKPENIADLSDPLKWAEVVIFFLDNYLEDQPIPEALLKRAKKYNTIQQNSLYSENGTITIAFLHAAQFAAEEAAQANDS